MLSHAKNSLVNVSIGGNTVMQWVTEGRLRWSNP